MMNEPDVDVQFIRELERRIEDKIHDIETLLIDRAAKEAVRQAFSHMGVDVDSPSDLQRFRDDLRFGGVFRAAATKGFFALIAAVCGGLGLSLWLALKDQMGIK